MGVSELQCHVLISTRDQSVTRLFFFVMDIHLETDGSVMTKAGPICKNQRFSWNERAFNCDMKV